MRHCNNWVLLFCITTTMVFASCTPHKETVSRYKYLMKEEDNVATKNNSGENLVKERAASLNIGEKLVPVLEEAKDFVGTPYRHGGNSKAGIDCSGLTQHCYSKAGVALPRSAADQSKVGEKIEREKLQIGDLVFFDAKTTGKIDHVGMVTKAEGNNVIFIHASSSKGVRFDYLNEGYWEDKLRDSRRVPMK